MSDTVLATLLQTTKMLFLQFRKSSFALYNAITFYANLEP